MVLWVMLHKEEYEQRRINMGFEESFYKDLGELIDKYAINKNELDSYKKLCDEDNKKIKDMMIEADLKNWSTSSFKASCSTSVRQTFDEGKLIMFFKSENIPDSLGIIKTREYIDEDALEAAIYNGLIPEETVKHIGDYMTEKTVYTLKVSKVKEA